MQQTSKIWKGEKVYLIEDKKTLWMLAIAACFFSPIPWLFWIFHHRKEMPFTIPIGLVFVIGGLVLHLHEAMNMVMGDVPLSIAFFIGNLLVGIFFLGRYLIVEKPSRLKAWLYANYLLLLIVTVLLFYNGYTTRDAYGEQWGHIWLYLTGAIFYSLWLMKQYTPQGNDSDGRTIL